ncbi:MAG: Uma2 family endonuclease [Acidobacteriaceae bacterium]|nr:Uma2 family endonuclease [Acidobacteriaceae bacterium]
MAATTTHLLTVEEFRALPEDSGTVYHELRHGEVVAVTRPKLKHKLVQRNLRRLLEEIAEPTSYVDTEMPFRPLPEYELWEADVAYVSPARFAEADPEDNVRGAPDLVIEVLSPSNTVDEMIERERICLENGAREFWVVDQKRRQVKVSTPDGRTITYRSGQEISLWFSNGRTVAVDAIFSADIFTR